jgi:hypothetical protein
MTSGWYLQHSCTSYKLKLFFWSLFHNSMNIILDPAGSGWGKEVSDRLVEVPKVLHSGSLWFFSNQDQNLPDRD